MLLLVVFTSVYFVVGVGLYYVPQKTKQTLKECNRSTVW